MADDPTTEETETEETTEETSEETVEETTEEQESETEETEEEETTEDGGLDLDGAKAALAKVRKSEAAMRVRLRDAEAKLKEAKTPEEFEALREQVAKDNAEEARSLLVENVALKHGLPDDLASALKGETREELEAHAKVLAKYAPSAEGGDDPELGGGLDPTTPADGGYDPQKRAKELRARRNRGF